MDDLETVRDFYGPPPSAPPALEHRIRAGLTGRRPRRIWAGLGAGLAAASVPAALLVSADDGREQATPPVAASSPPVVLDARRILLAAASSSREEPRETGTYWRTRVLQGAHRVIPGKDYLVEYRQQAEFWLSPKAGVREYFVATDLGHRPLDPEAWRRDGSPKVWRFKLPDRVVDGRTVIEHSPQVIRMAGGRERVHFYPNRFGLGRIAGEEITPKLLADLPTDGRRLLRWITSRWDGLREGVPPEDLPRPEEKAHLENHELFQLGVTLISRAPGSPALRAAAYEMLALIPTVEARGEVTDPLGRKGVAVALPGQGTEYETDAETGRMTPAGDRYDQLLIIDPATGRALASTWVVTESELGFPGRLMNYEVFQESSWEDEVPARFRHARPAR